MATYPHPVIQKPPDVNIPIWRYMDFTKFVSMLENDGLYLARADKLGDPNEAIAIRSTFQKLDDVLNLSCFLGTVSYIDYERDWLPEGNLLYPFVHKRYPYLSTQELDNYNCIAQETMHYGWSMIDDMSFIDDPSASATFKSKILERYPCINQDNLSRLFSQGCYYALK
jgi:hypothetical protein